MNTVDPRLPDDPRDEFDDDERHTPTLPSRGAPPFVRLIVYIVLFGSGLVGASAWAVAESADRQRMADCERAVAYRGDNRAMWLWIGREFGDVEMIRRITAQLDTQLPELRCDDAGHTIPVPTVE